MLTIIGEIGANGCNYQVMEFTGEGAKTLSINDRMVLCNLCLLYTSGSVINPAGSYGCHAGEQ